LRKEVPGMPGRVAANRIRLGILALPVAGVLVVVGDLILPSFGSLSEGASYAETVVSRRFELVASIYTLGDVLYLFGVFALYAFLASGPGERWGLAGLVLVVVWLVSINIYNGTVGFTEPALGRRYLDGNEEAFITYDSGLYTDAVFFALDWFGYVGFVLLGVGIWRSGTLPQGAAILGIASVVLGPVAYAVTADLALVTDLLLAAASGWIAWVVWRQLSPTNVRSWPS
jgi:hypothetical protein